ncbi:MAG: B12-binding domain-containing radical SAM protein, partial [Anaerolineae bacterium]
PADLPGDPAQKTALLINPPVYDTQYWAEWSQPYGLLRIARLLAQLGYKRRELFDFMEATGDVARRKVAQRRIAPGESFVEKNTPDPKSPPYRIEKDGQTLELWKYHFGKSWDEFDRWLDERGFTPANPPDEVWISATMTYWWESARDLVGRLRRRWGPHKPLILLGGIYPTLAPEHAAQYVQPDIVVAGEVEAANDLWPDLSLYDTPPAYAIITPARGCPYDCAYCAQLTINGGQRRVRYRPVADIVREMHDAQDRYGIKDFAFYADFLLWDFEHNFQPLLEALVADTKAPGSERRFYRLYAPEGFDVRFLSRSQRLVDLLKAANFQKIYLPCESIDDSYLAQLNRRHVRLQDFVAAARMCERAGFNLRHMDVNAFVLYGLPGERIDHVVKTILFVSEVVGSIIPMLFSPVPSTALYRQYLPYFQARGWDRDLHMLNGKLYPFLAMNEGSVSDYVDLQRLMYMLNAHYRSRSFQLFGGTMVAQAFRENLRNGFEEFIAAYLTTRA